jgi:hypothetical protein
LENSPATGAFHIFIEAICRSITLEVGVTFLRERMKTGGQSFGKWYSKMVQQQERVRLYK